MHIDVGKADTYWDATLPRIKKIRLNTSHEKELQKKLDMDKHFIDLMNYGFDRRLIQSSSSNLINLEPDLSQEADLSDDDEVKETDSHRSLKEEVDLYRSYNINNSS